VVTSKVSQIREKTAPSSKRNNPATICVVSWCRFWIGSSRSRLKGVLNVIPQSLSVRSLTSWAQNFGGVVAYRAILSESFTVRAHKCVSCCSFWTGDSSKCVKVRLTGLADAVSSSSGRCFNASIFARLRNFIARQSQMLRLSCCMLRLCRVNKHDSLHHFPFHNSPSQTVTKW